MIEEMETYQRTDEETSHFQVLEHKTSYPCIQTPNNILPVFDEKRKVINMYLETNAPFV